jgi:dUTP pyrophosphatase
MTVMMTSSAVPLWVQEMQQGPLLKYYLTGEAKQAGITLFPPRGMDAGFDLPSLCDVSVPAKGFALLRTGVHLAIPEGGVGIVCDRSSVALKGGAGTAGVIDSAYRGEVKIAMHNFGDSPLLFKCGERIAQLVIVQHLEGTQSAQVESIEQLGVSERGKGGFGSTGR